MATAAVELKRMQARIKKLETELTRVQRAMREQGILPSGKRTTTRKGKLSERERVREILRNAGMLAELTPEDKALAAEWRALPEERKQEVIRKLDSIRFNPPLSETIIRDRG